MVRDHPTIREVYIFLKLYRDHFRIDLNYRPLKPVPGTIAFLFVIAKDLNPVADFIGLISLRSIGEK